MLAGAITRHPGAVAIVLVLVTLLSAWRASRLEINSNQLDLLPQDLPAIQATHQMIDVIGGVGFLMLALKSDDEGHLKAVADDLAARLRSMAEVRGITYKQDVSFILDRIGLYVETADLEEAYQRIRKKVKATLRAANPFHVQLRETKDEPLVLDDLIAKYRRMNKKSVDDPYYIDDEKEMLIILIKPMWEANQLARTRDFLAKLEGMMSDYNASNAHGAKLLEGYGAPAPGATVTYGYSGGYKTNVDDSDTMKDALVPTAAVSFVGVFIYILVFLRRVIPVVLIMSTLLVGTVMTFAFCELAIGELNTITSILAAILFGLGIDFGIHFVHRLREEYTRTRDITRAIEETIEHSGSASAASASTIAAALFVLAFAQFRGFSDFGLLAGVGVIITALMAYTFIPTIYVLADRVWPRFKEHLVIVSKRDDGAELGPRRPYPFARLIVLGSVALTAVLAVLATRIQFDYDGRSLMSADRPSLLLQEEITRRFEVSGDPVGFYTETLEEARALYERLQDIPADSMIESVASIFTLVPPPEKQEANRKIMAQLLEDLAPITPDMLSEDEAEKLEKMRYYLGAQPFGIEDVPEWIAKQFRPVPESKYKGYITFVYPKTSLWDGRELIKFGHEIDHVAVGGKSYHSAGIAVLFSMLAEIILAEGKVMTLYAALVICVILLITFRRPTALAFAMLPVSAGMLWMLGLMAATGWKLNFMNVVVFPVVLGYGISGGIHLYHRFIEGNSVMLAVRHAGTAVTASSITTLIGYGALLVSQHRGLISMGILACLGVASALVVSLTLLPALLQVWQDRQTRRGSAAPVIDLDTRKAS